MKPYLMEITETFTKRVIIWAEDKDDAVERTEALCNKDEIKAENGGSFRRDVFCHFRANDDDLNIFEQYGKDDE